MFIRYETHNRHRLIIPACTLVVVVSVCLSVTTLAGATRTLWAQLRYQKKALDTRIKLTVGTELRVLSSKVMTVCSSPEKL